MGAIWSHWETSGDTHSGCWKGLEYSGAVGSREVVAIYSPNNDLSGAQVLREHDIERFDVAVDDTVRVKVVHAEADLVVVVVVVVVVVLVMLVLMLLMLLLNVIVS